ncbi:MAG TPA: DUF4142 domain-containing protein [Sphingomonas sp.]|jgi:putative membrane protein|nr:DUF4142 domain-containing protein [Sphingomonas sp.]
MMKMLSPRWPAMAAAALALVPAAAAAQAPMTAAQYVKRAGASDLYERRSSMLVMRSTNDRVRDFANMMIRDHDKSTRQVTSAARQARLDPGKPMLEPRQTRMLARLRAVSGARRDRLYVTQQRTAHRMALDLHRSYAAGGAARPLKLVATNVVPVVRHHLDMLDRM